MSYKLLEQNGIDNENVDGGAFNRFAAGSRDGIIQGVLSECAMMTIGNGIGIYPGLILLCGMRLKITEMEYLFVSSVPAVPTQYQIIVEVTLSEDRGVTPNIYLRAPADLKQESLYRAEKGVYQVELGSFVHNPDGSITNLLRTLDVITGGGAGGGSGTIEVGNITTETLSPGLEAEFDVTMRKDAENQKDLLDFHAAIPQGKGVQNAEVSYKASESGVDVPDEEGWLTSIPAVKGGEYLWTRVVINYSDGENTTFYSVSKFSSDNSLLPSNSTPLMDGEGSAGSASSYSREDHVHPSDTSKANTDGNYPDMTVGNATNAESALQAEKLSTNRLIDGLSFDGSGNTDRYVVCSTVASASAKIVAKTGFATTNDIVAGARITIKFTNANTAANAALVVNGKSARIKADGDTGSVKWLAGAIMEFVYDGANWVCVAGYQLAGMPVGYIYISTSPTSPATLFGGTWTAITEDYYLRAITSGNSAYADAGLPNIEGTFGATRASGYDEADGAFYQSDTLYSSAAGSGKYGRIYFLDASRSSKIYGKSNTVTPANYGVYMWRRTA